MKKFIKKLFKTGLEVKYQMPGQIFHSTDGKFKWDCALKNTTATLFQYLIMIVQLVSLLFSVIASALIAAFFIPLLIIRSLWESLKNLFTKN